MATDRSDGTDFEQWARDARDGPGSGFLRARIVAACAEVGRQQRRAERAEAAVQQVRAETLREAADEVQKEARWQIEQHYRNVFTYGEGILDRLDILKRILLDRASALDGTPDGGDR